MRTSSCPPLPQPNPRFETRPTLLVASFHSHLLPGRPGGSVYNTPMLDPVEKQPALNPESDSFWHQDMARLPPGDEGSSVTEVHIGGKSAVREILETVVLTLLIFLAVRALGQNFVVEGESMLPTLTNNQYLIVDKVSYARWDSNFLPRLFGQDVPTDTHYLLGNGPQRGDIIVFHA